MPLYPCDPNYDLEAWNGDTWGTHESELNTKDEADMKKKGVCTAPVFKHKMITGANRQVRTDELRVYSLEEIKN